MDNNQQQGTDIASMGNVWQTPEPTNGAPITSTTQPQSEPVVPSNAAAVSMSDSPWKTTPVTPVAETVNAPSPWQAAPVAAPTPAAPQALPTPMAPQNNVSAPTQQTSPWQAAPVAAPTLNTQPTEAVAPEAPLPMKRKMKVPPAVMGVVAIFVVAGVAGGTYLLSKGVSSEQPVAPNAPSSVPRAFDPSEEAGLVGSAPVTSLPPFDPNGTIDCAGKPNTAPYGNRCLPTVKNASGEVVWAPGALQNLK